MLKRIVSLGLIFLGSVLMSSVALWQWQEWQEVEIVQGFEVKSSLGVRPERIIIERFGVDLEVSAAGYKSGEWEISEEGASHWFKSASPGEGVNVVIYGHNKDDLLGPIRWVGEGEVIKVVNREGEVFEYEIDEIIRADKGEVKYVMPTNDERLTIYTCDGSRDRLRYVVIGKPAS